MLSTADLKSLDEIKMMSTADLKSLNDASIYICNFSYIIKPSDNPLVQSNTSVFMWGDDCLKLSVLSCRIQV